MALIEIDGLPNLIAWWIFPWLLLLVMFSDGKSGGFPSEIRPGFPG